MKISPLVAFFLILSSATAQNNDKRSAVLEFQRNLNETFMNPGTTPLPQEEWEDIQPLKFYPIDLDYHVVADFVRTPYEMPFSMPTSTGEENVFVKYGEAYFDLEGKEYMLELYRDRELSKTTQYRNYLFLPFTDLSNGETTYSAGRYIDLEIPTANKIIIDFNQAYNPLCAYNGEYSCPIPPRQNHLETRIEAGIMDY